MRKLKLQVQLSLDGFMAGPNGEMEFITWNWDQALQQYVADLTGPVGTIVMGRKLAAGFIPHWADVAADAGSAEQAAGKKFTDTPKVVFSQTLAEHSWPNTTLCSGDLATEINRLKQQEGGDIIAYGGASFVAALVHAQVVDEYHLFINPTAIGKGLPLFGGATGKQELALVKALPFACGIVVLHYQPKG